MAATMGTEALLIFFLILVNGVLAMAEISLVSARKVRLLQRAQSGDRGAQAALELAESPGRFLSTVQVGITLIGILAGAFGGATLAEQIAARVAQVPALAPYSEAIGIGLVVLGITYLSLIFGELVPKQLGLHSPERIAALLARPLRLVSKVAAPAVFLLDGSTRLVLRLLGARPSDDPPVTAEEVNHLLRQGTHAGIFEEGEQEIVARVLRLGERRIGELLTPRHAMVALDVDAPLERSWQRIAESGHVDYPVYEGGLDRVIGVISLKDLWREVSQGRKPDLRSLLREPLYLPEGVTALRALERLRKTGSHLALVIDEYGGTEGLLTLHDVLRAIVGELPVPEQDGAMAVQREDGSWLLDGLLQVSGLRPLLGLSAAEAEEIEEYRTTLGGFVMSRLGRVPQAGNYVEWRGWRFEVVDMDDRRVDTVLAARVGAEEGGERPPGSPLPS